MEDLIAALNIFLKYTTDKNSYSPTHCEHDVFMVVGIEEDQVSEEDRVRLDELGFHWDNEYDCWSSFRFGSA